MIVTIDLNVILDVYLLRGNFDAAMMLLSRCIKGEISGNIPSHGVPTIYYILKKHLGNSKAREIAGQLLDVLEIIPVDKRMLQEARKSSMADFEDAIVEAAAFGTGSNFIITENLRDFTTSRIPVVTPAQLLLGM